ncbi:DEAD/DEAH box helicase [Saccharibacter sp. 17.LH.SD]|nr:DEAD/DEAH box helicase [Saccharibacter sp. 17.LH.SD]MXV44605.1 DEAD/DEAH box helicase [Saccharibacter sp. 17.LH.SD]
MPSAGAEDSVAKPKRRGRKPAAAKKVELPASETVSSEEMPVPAKPRRRVTRKKLSKAEEEKSSALPAATVSDAQEERIALPDTHVSSNTAKKDEAPSPAKQENTLSFQSLNLSAPILRAIDEMGYTHPTPIQERAIPEILGGWDVLGVAQTGTGKTASFTLPLLEKLSKSRGRARMPRSLILEPTRELALQVADNFEKYGKYLRLNHALLIGGESMNEQREKLNQGVDVLIATPGRLIDLFDRGGLLLTQTDLLVIDEADRMLDMGFIPDIERIVSLLPWHHQTLFFSATMAPEIRRLADKFLSSPREITVSRQSSVASTITERLFLVEKDKKPEALLSLVQNQDVDNAIVFCNRKRDVDMLQSYLARKHLSAGHLHGDLTQSLRFSTLERFRSGDLKILVCSDVAARGIDIGGLSYVFNYDLSFNAEDYVHRIGRTGRAGKEGHAFSLATPDERPLLEAIEKLTKKTIERGTIEGFPSLEWRSDDNETPPDPSTPRGKKEHEPRQRAPKQARHNKSSDRPSREEDRSSRNKHHGLLPPVPEKDDMQHGFGENVPAFMKVSFRPTPRND